MPPDPALVPRMRVHDAMRMQQPSTVLNRKVYDSIGGDPLREVNLHVNGDQKDCEGELGADGDGRHASGADARHAGDGHAADPASFMRQRTTEGPAGPRIDVEDSFEGVSSSETTSRFSSPPLLRPYYTPRDEQDVTLMFESRFESGNLCRAIQVYDFEYDLILRPDINTNRHTQWFYFRISNTRRGHSYKLNIINMMKTESLYEQGQRVLAFSERQYAEDRRGWFHTGHNIAYYQNNIRRPNGQHYYTLTFTIDTEHDQDNVYIAHCYPYSYSELQYYLQSLENDPVKSRHIRRRKLCDTLAGNSCDVLTVTSFDTSSSCASTAAVPMKQRRGVVVTGRVHPGESNASWMMKGFIDFLLGISVEARRLRDNFIFKIVPMLNPDGVIWGNYRCSLARVDLNRVWHDPCRRRHPTIWHTKEMIRRFVAERPVVLYADLHGHSLRHNIFTYGCEKRGNNNNSNTAACSSSSSSSYASTSIGNASSSFSVAGASVDGTAPSTSLPSSSFTSHSPTGGGSVPSSSTVVGRSGYDFGGVHPALARRIHERVFPLLLHQNASSIFSFSDCNFKVQRCKETTARVVVWREFQITNSFTVEASFAGSSVSGAHFTQSCLMSMGKSLAKTILQYCGIGDKDAAVNAAYRTLETIWRSAATSMKKKNLSVSAMLAAAPVATAAVSAPSPNGSLGRGRSSCSSARGGGSNGGGALLLHADSRHNGDTGDDDADVGRRNGRACDAAIDGDARSELAAASAMMFESDDVESESHASDSSSSDNDDELGGGINLDMSGCVREGGSSSSSESCITRRRNDCAAVRVDKAQSSRQSMQPSSQRNRRLQLRQTQKVGTAADVAQSSATEGKRRRKVKRRASVGSLVSAPAEAAQTSSKVSTTAASQTRKVKSVLHGHATTRRKSSAI